MRMWIFHYSISKVFINIRMEKCGNIQRERGKNRKRISSFTSFAYPFQMIVLLLLFCLYSFRLLYRFMCTFFVSTPFLHSFPLLCFLLSRFSYQFTIRKRTRIFIFKCFLLCSLLAYCVHPSFWYCATLLFLLFLNKTNVMWMWIVHIKIMHIRIQYVCSGVECIHWNMQM